MVPDTKTYSLLTNTSKYYNTYGPEISHRIPKLMKTTTMTTATTIITTACRQVVMVGLGSDIKVKMNG